MNNGYIKIHRKFQKWGWYTAPNHTFFFTHILMEANYEDHIWKGILIKRGSLVTSLNSLTFKTCISKSCLRTIIKHLILTHDITCESTHHFTIITICNYEAYQCRDDETNTVTDTPTDTQLTHKSHTTDTRLTPLKELKKERTKEKEIKKEKVRTPYIPHFEKPSPDAFQRFVDTYETIKPFNNHGNLVALKAAFHEAVAEVGEDKIILAAEDCSYSYKVTGVAVRFRKSPEKWLEEKQYNICWTTETQLILDDKGEIPPDVFDRLFERIRFLHKLYPNIEWEK